MRLRRDLDLMQDNLNKALLGQQLQPDSKSPLGEQRDLRDTEFWGYDTGTAGTLPSSIIERQRDSQGRFMAGSYKMRNYSSQAGDLSGIYPEVMSAAVNPAYDIKNVFNKISPLQALNPQLEDNRISIQHLVRNYDGGDPTTETSYIYSDPASGLLSITSQRNPNTRFAVPSLITPEGKITNPLDVLHNELYVSMQSAGANGIPRHSPVRGLQNIGAINYNVDEMTPYRNAVLANVGQVVTGMITDPDTGERRRAPVYSSDLLETMNSAPDWYTQGESHLINKAAIGAMVPQDAQGNYLLDNMKRTKSLSRTSGIYEPVPGMAMQRMYEPVRNAGSPYANSGYVQMTAYGFDSNVAEGSAMASDKLGFVTRYKDYTVPLSESQLALAKAGKNPFEFAEGDVYFHRNTHDKAWLDPAQNKGFASEISGLPDFEPGSNLLSRIGAIRYDFENQNAIVSVGRSVSALGADNKGQHKTHIMGVDPNAPMESNMLRRRVTNMAGDTLDVNLDFYAGVPSTSDLQAIGRSINRAKFANDTKGYEAAFTSFATENFRRSGTNLLYKDDAGFADATPITPEAAKTLFNRGVVGGENTLIHARMDQQAIIDNTVLLDPKRITVSGTRLRSFIAGSGDNITINPDQTITGMKTFEFRGQQIQSYRDVEAIGDDLYTVTAQEMAIVAPTFNYYSQTFDRGRSDIGPDELNQIANANPALYENLLAQEKAGLTFRNYSSEILRSVALNESQLSSLRDTMTRSGQIIDASKIDLAGLMADLPAGNNRNAEMLRVLAESEYGDSYIRMADTRNSVMAPARAILNSMLEDEDGNIQTGFARTQAEMLAAHEMLATESRMGVVSDITRQRIDDTTAIAIASAEKLAAGEKFQKRAYGISLPTVGGAISAVAGLKINEIAMPRNTIYDMFGVYGLDKEARPAAMQEIDDQLKAGTLTTVVNAFPKTTTNSADQMFNVVDVAEVKKRKGMEWISENEIQISEEAVTSFSKDTDGDRWRQWVTRKLASAANALGFSWVGERLAATDPAKMMSRMNVAVNELSNMDEAGTRDWQEVLKDFRNILAPGKLLSTAESLLTGPGKSARAAFDSKADIGVNYNALYRSQIPFIDMLGKNASDTLSEDNFGKLKDAQDVLANYVYQEGTKLKGVSEGSVEFLKDIRRSGTFTVGEKGEIGAGYYKGDNWKSLGSGWSNIAQNVIRSQATLGMGYEHYDDLIAPAMAQSMLPLKEQGNEKMRNKLTKLLQKANKSFDPEVGLSDDSLTEMRKAVGLQHYSDWAVGVNGDMSTVSPQFSHAMGILADRALTLGEKDPTRREAGLSNEGALPKNLRTFAGMYRQTEAAQKIIANKDGLLEGLAYATKAIAGSGGSTFQRYQEVIPKIFGQRVPESVRDLAEQTLDSEAPLKHVQAVASSAGMSFNQPGSSAHNPSTAQARRDAAIDDIPEMNANVGPMHYAPITREEFESDERIAQYMADSEAAAPSKPKKTTPPPASAASRTPPTPEQKAAYKAAFEANNGGSAPPPSGGSTPPPNTPPPNNNYNGGDFGGGNVYANHAQFTVQRYGTPALTAADAVNVGSALHPQRMETLETFIKSGASIADISDRSQRTRMRSTMDLYLKAGDVAGKYQSRMNEGKSKASDVLEFMQNTGIASVDDPKIAALQQYRKELTEASVEDKASGLRDTDRVGRATLSSREVAGSKDAADNLERMSSVIQRLSEETKNYTSVGKEHVETIKGVSRAYEKIEGTLAKLSKIQGSGTLTEDEKTLQSRLSGVLGSMGDDLKQVRSARNALSDGALQTQGYVDPEERSSRVMSALLATGVSGSRRRSRLSNEDWEAAESETGVNRNLLQVGGATARVASHAQNALWAMTHIQHNIINPLIGEANYYQQRQLERDQTLMSAGLISYNDLMNGQGGTLLRQQARGSMAKERFGQQVYMAYSGFLNNPNVEDQAAAFGAGASVFAPALAGAALGQAVAGPIGAGVLGVAGLGFGALNYFNAASKDVDSVMRSTSSRIMNNGDFALNIDTVNSAITRLNPDVYDKGRKYGHADASIKQFMQMGSIATQNGFAVPSSTSDAYSLISSNLGLSMSDVEGLGVRNYIDDNIRRGTGLQSEDATSLYAFMRTYMPSSRVFGNATLAGLEKYTAAGITTLPQDAIQAAVSVGKSQFDVLSVGAAAGGIVNYLDAVSASGGNVNLAQQDAKIAMQSAYQVNQSLISAGLPATQWETLTTRNNAFMRNPFTAAGYLDTLQTRGANRVRNTALSDSADVRYQNAQWGRLIKFDMLGFNQAREGYATGFNLADSYMQFGMTAQKGADIALFTSNLSLVNQSRYARAAQGDPYMLSSMASQGQISPQFATIDMSSGMSIYQDKIGPSEYSDILRMAMQTNRAGMMGTPLMMAGGITGMQKSIRDLQVSTADQQYSFQVKSAGLNLAYQRTMWGLEDAGVGLQRQQQRFGMQQQAQGLALQEGQFALSGQQFAESRSLSQRQFQFNTSTQRVEMDIGRYQQTRQNQWQREDLAFNRDQSEVQFGWQMEDFDRNIRYARGRERLDLIRQQSRAVISQSMQTGQMDKQENRAEETIKWETERYEREKKRFEQSVEFSKEEFDMQKKHFEEGRNFDRQRLDMQKAAFEKESAWMKQQWAIEDQQRNVTRQHTVQMTQLQAAQAASVYNAQVQMRKYEEAIQLANETLERRNKQIELERQTGDLAVKVMGQFTQALSNVMTGAGQTITALNNVAAGAGQAAGALNSLFSNSYNSALHQQYQYKNAPQFDVGGYTGDGPRNQPAGVVHKGEYVVPQNGTLVTRGDNVQTVEVLSRMLRVLERIEAQGPGTLNATIYTNQPTVSTKTLTNIDKAYARG